MRLFLFLLFSFPTFSSELDETLFKKISTSRQWHSLMHYEPHWGGFESRADAVSFFFAKEGKYKPLQELKASYQAFKKRALVKDLNNDPRCRFPARFEYIKKNLDPGLENAICPDFEQWISSLDPQTLSLVYTSSFPNNPASTFGHTFIKIVSKKSAAIQNAKGNNKKLDLLDYYVGFSAQIADPNPIEYIIKGLTGGFPGKFEMGPYYLKVNEYNNMESRDLWEFQLNFTVEQTRRMLAHIWELSRNTHFDYFFMDENCSSLLLKIFEVGRPDWQLLHPWTMTVPPPETIKPLAEINGAIKAIHFRPSLFKRFRHQYNFLTSLQKKRYHQVIQKKVDVKDIKDPYLIEVAMGNFMVAKKKDPIKFKREDQRFYTQLLIQRSRLPIIDNTEFDRVTSDSRPDLSHGDNLVAIGMGAVKDSLFQEIWLRPFLHDFLSHDIGQPQYSHIEGFSAKLRYYFEKNKLKNKLQLDELTVLSIGSLFPSTEFSRKFSYDAGLTLFTPDDLNCLDCRSWRLQGRGGHAFELIADSLLLYALGGAQVEYNDLFNHNFRYGPNARLGVHFKGRRYRNHFFIDSFWDLGQHERLKFHQVTHFDQSLSLGRNKELRLEMSFYQNHHDFDFNKYEHKLSLLFHF